MKTIVKMTLAASLGLGGLYAASGSADAAAQCMKAGGWGANLMHGVAEFMAEAAMKNSAKARLGSDAIKVGNVSQKCEQKGLLVECIATAKVCK